MRSVIFTRSDEGYFSEPMEFDLEQGIPAEQILHKLRHTGMLCQT